jgi:hypothetical protein
MLRHRRNWRPFLAGVICFLALFLLSSSAAAQDGRSNGNGGRYFITGRLVDSQEQPIVDAEIIAHSPGEEAAQPLAETASLADGSFILRLSELPFEQTVLTIEAHHFAGRQERLAGQPIPWNGGLRPVSGWPG